MLSTFLRSSSSSRWAASRALKLVSNRASSTTVTSGFTSNTAAVTAKFESYTIATSGYTSYTDTVTAEFECFATATSGYTLNTTSIANEFESTTTTSSYTYELHRHNCRIREHHYGDLL
ncbi:hypothetical protein TIFTF001_017736 [Ficus carica]|uniref:Uncharacterized protein n=1 Tax=Ficus carica TaxID=3494 RepID=A0AA88A5N0_FICCA|nr:hypothetical protein TIFTF001_017736 [Ficus carica]